MIINLFVVYHVYVENHYVPGGVSPPLATIRMLKFPRNVTYDFPDLEQHPSPSYVHFDLQGIA